jgi:protein-S-isoprenylcysteine O-methyltransferase Ste14
MYTFWDYKRDRWRRDAGLRLDHLLLSASLEAGWPRLGSTATSELRTERVIMRQHGSCSGDITSACGRMRAERPRMDQPRPIELWWAATYLLATLLLFALLLFLPAGTIAWWQGWRFLLVVSVAIAAAALWLWRVNPEIYVARRRIHKGTKRWDLILLCFLAPAMLAILPVAALDDARFHWFPLPTWAIGSGYALLLAGIGLIAWAQAVNRFFEPGVRIQIERGHGVIDTGPYAIVRHPGYVGACLLFAGTALSLGSLWALVPAWLAAAILMLRTHWEDQTLQTELTGYQDYAQRVRFRLIPGLW